MFTKSSRRRNASEIVGIYGNQYKDRIKKSVYFYMLTIINNGQFKNRWTICICIGSKMIASVLRPRLHGAGSARSQYQIEHFQDERGS